MEISHFRRLATLLGSLYIAQMLAPAFVMNALPSILRESGESLDKISWLYGIGMVWSVNFLWAPLVDRFGHSRFGHYKGWIIAMQVLLFSTLVIAIFYPATEHYELLLILLSFAALFSSTQDVATDALAIQILATKERGIGNAIQASGNLIGGILGGGMMLISYAYIGWVGCLALLSAYVFFASLPVLLYQETPRVFSTNQPRPGYVNIIRFFRRPGILHWVLILLTLRSVGMVAHGMLGPLLVDMGWELQRIGIAMHLIGPVFGLAGAAAAGWVITKFGRKFTVQLSMAFTALTALGMLLPANGFTGTVVIYSIIWALNTAYGFGSTALYTVIMDKCDPVSAGTDFSLQMALTNGAMFVAVGIALNTVEQVGYSIVLYTSLILVVAFMVLIQAYDGFKGEPSEQEAKATVAD